jgi:hypothetical protein
LELAEVGSGRLLEDAEAEARMRPGGRAAGVEDILEGVEFLQRGVPQLRVEMV